LDRRTGGIYHGCKSLGIPVNKGIPESRWDGLLDGVLLPSVFLTSRLLEAVTDLVLLVLSAYLGPACESGFCILIFFEFHRLHFVGVGTELRGHLVLGAKQRNRGTGEKGKRGMGEERNGDC